MTGHANEKELDLIRKLESNMDVLSSPIQNLFQLGILYYEPLHDYKKAIKIFEKILEREPNNTWAKFWIAFICCYELLHDVALLRAKKLLESCDVKTSKEGASVHELLAYVLRDLKEITKQDEKYIDLLERSIKLQPNWVGNRHSLADAYLICNRIKDAIEQLECARSNIILPLKDWDVVEEYFETMVTFRANKLISDSIEKQLNKLKSLKQ